MRMKTKSHTARQSRRIQSDAVHEAAHAVAAVALGVPVLSLSLDVFVIKPACQPFENVQFLNACGVAICAGAAAQQQFAQDGGGVSDLDLEALQAALDYVVPDAHAQCAQLRQTLLEYWQQKSAKLVAWHWPVVTALANELLARREMTGQAVERFVRARI